METHVFKVPGVSCEHCRRAITRSVEKLSGVQSVDVDLNGKTVTVSFDPGRTTVHSVREAIEEAGYDVTP